MKIGSTIMEGKKILVTTKEWFYGPDGELYRAVLGEKILHNDAFLRLGSDERKIDLPWESVVSVLYLKDDELPTKKDILIIN